MGEPSWSSIESLGKSKILQTSYYWLIIVPLVAKILSAINRTLTFKLFDAEVLIHVGLPFSWRIFYFSTIILTVANIIYYFRCPAIIKNYKTFEDFDKQGKGAVQLGGYLLNLLRECDETLGAQISKMPYATLRRNIHTRSIEQESAGAMGDINAWKRDLISNPGAFSANNTNFWVVRDLSGYIRSKSLWCCVVFYSFGMILLSWLLLENTIYVIEAMQH